MAVLNSSSSLVFCYFQQFSDVISHLLSYLHLDLSDRSSIHYLFLPLYHAITPSFPTLSSLAHHFASLMS